jgi:drug/metabolite transporter (DMT)-like permease
VTAILLAIVAALLLGVSDFSAARASRQVHVFTVVRTSVLTSTVLSPLLLLLVESRFSVRDSLFGAASGIFMILGLILVYRGYVVSRIGIVAPLSSVLIAAVPVLWDVVSGSTPAAMSAVGMALGVVAMALTSYAPGHGGSAASGILYGVTSGISFGLAWVLMSGVSNEAGVSSVPVQRIAGLALLFAIWAVRDDPMVAPAGPARWYSMGAGVAGVVALASLQVAFQSVDGSAAGPVSVASSQFGSITVLLAVVLNRERMRWWQSVGVVATAIAVALIAYGG